MLIEMKESPLKFKIGFNRRFDDSKKTVWSFRKTYKIVIQHRFGDIFEF